MSISPAHFYKAYPTLTEGKAEVKGKMRNLSEELYLINKLMSTNDLKTKKRLHEIAVHIYGKRHKTPTFCNQIVSLIYNLFCGRVGTTEFFFKKIQEEGKQHHLSQLITSQPSSSKASTPSAKPKASTPSAPSFSPQAYTLPKVSSSSSSASNAPKTFQEEFTERYGALWGGALEVVAREEISDFFDKSPLAGDDLQKIEWFFQNFIQGQMKDLICGLFSGQTKKERLVNFITGLQCCSEQDQEECVLYLLQMRPADDSFILNYMEVSLTLKSSVANAYLNQLYKTNDWGMLNVIKQNFVSLSSSPILMDWLEQYAPEVLQSNSLDVKEANTPRAVEVAKSMKKDLSKLAEWLSYLHEVNSYLDNHFALNFQAIMKTLTPTEIAGLANINFFKLDGKYNAFKVQLIFESLNKEQIEALEDALITDDVDLGTMANIIIGFTYSDKGVGYNHFIDLLSEKALEKLFAKITPKLIEMNLADPKDKQNFAFALQEFINAYWQRALVLNNDHAKMLLKVFKEKSPLVFDSYYKKVNSKYKATIDSLLQ